MKQRQQGPLTVITDEEIVRAEAEKAARGREALLGPRIEAEQQRVAARKAARRDLYGAVERLVEQDAAARGAAEVLRAAAGQERVDPVASDRTSRDAPRLPGTESFRAAAGNEETLLFASDHYSYWTYGNVYGSSFDDHAATDYAFSIFSNDGEPDSPYGAVGFNVAVQTSEPIAFLNIKPLLRYQYKARLTSSESWLGDGSASGRSWFNMIVWQDGKAVTGYAQYPLWSNAVSGSSLPAEDDGWASDFTLGFEMTAGLPVRGGDRAVGQLRLQLHPRLLRWCEP
ncbi:hypothetical protein [Streptomyces sp. NPDC096311]|uniref:hypothetical protein n=1 Tax=Streptomyces sp. NPDC096311 TaxID=3366083 RepID=UPI00380EC0BA